MQNKKILLTTLNARYHHSSLALRYLLVNLKGPSLEKKILEFSINERPDDLAFKILQERPDYVSFSVYIWNVEETLNLLKILRSLRVKFKIILGGPEFISQSENHPLFSYADYIVEGEGEEVLGDILKNDSSLQKIWKGKVVHLEGLILPYDEYSEEDLKNRFIYVETTRGCPYRCAFCLSSLDEKVRFFPLEKIFPSFEKLIKKGAKHFKFVDRTFNFNEERGILLMKFFLPYKDVFLHFEIVPEILTEEFILTASLFEEGRLQFEMGIQTLSENVAKKIQRYLDRSLIEKNMKAVLEKTKIHVHADLIVGLPEETFEQIRSNFDVLFKMNPHEIQLGILKILRGVPLDTSSMTFSPLSPYEILENKNLSFEMILKFKRMARFLDLVFNHGQFPTLKSYVLNLPSPFDFLWDFSDFAFLRHGKNHSISLDHLTEILFDFLKEKYLSEDQAKELLLSDFSKVFGRSIPKNLRESPLSKRQKRGHFSSSGL